MLSDISKSNQWDLQELMHHYPVWGTFKSLAFLLSALLWRLGDRAQEKYRER